MEDAKIEEWADKMLEKYFNADRSDYYNEQVVGLKSKEEVTKFAEDEFNSTDKGFAAVAGCWEKDEDIAKEKLEDFKEMIHSERFKQALRKGFIDHILLLWKRFKA